MCVLRELTPLLASCYSICLVLDRKFICIYIKDDLLVEQSDPVGCFLAAHPRSVSSQIWAHCHWHL